MEPREQVAVNKYISGLVAPYTIDKFKQKEKQWGDIKYFEDSFGIKSSNMNYMMGAYTTERMALHVKDGTGWKPQSQGDLKKYGKVVWQFLVSNQLTRLVSPSSSLKKELAEYLSPERIEQVELVLKTPQRILKHGERAAHATILRRCFYARLTVYCKAFGESSEEIETYVTRIMAIFDALQEREAHIHASFIYAVHNGLLLEDERGNVLVLFCVFPQRK